MIRSCAWLSCVFSYRDLKQEQEHAQEVRCSRDCYSHGKCLADLCGALHCDAVMNFKSSRSKCNPVAAARNRRLCESLADNCFPKVRVHQQAAFTNYFCTKFVTLAQRNINPSLEEARIKVVSSAWLLEH
ncbi:hypothetical protein glysoja_040022 [Glycine soja]|uniref:Uncharacterized protein n=1 Tax=Glycine soja TaxID=3848 RepID=A0A0B2P600_GLYSO|nr:hypothetical protein glysoja_040022 [Glycine soja]